MRSITITNCEICEKKKNFFVPLNRKTLKSGATCKGQFGAQKLLEQFFCGKPEKTKKFGNNEDTVENLRIEFTKYL